MRCIKKILVSLLALCLLAGCGPDLARYPRVEPSSREVQRQTLTIDLPRDADELTLNAVSQLGSALLELSDGAITLETCISSHPIAALVGGDTHLALLENRDLIQADPSMGFLDWPFLLGGVEQYLAVMGAEDGAVRGSGSLREALGGEVIGLWYGGRTVLLCRGTFYPEISFSGISLGVLEDMEGSGYFTGMLEDLRPAAVYTGSPNQLIKRMESRAAKYIEYPLAELDADDLPQDLKCVEDTAHRVQGLWLVLGKDAVDEETALIVRAAAAYVPQSVLTARTRQEEELFQALEAADIPVKRGDYAILNRASREYFRKNYEELGCSQRAWSHLFPVLA